MELFPIHISNFKVDGGAMFGVVPKLLWQRKYPADENNLCNWALRSILAVTGNRVILVDNGYGDKQDEKFFSHVHLNGGDGLEGALAKAGYAPEQVTDMVLTHLHSDHCGGGVKRKADGSGYEMTFPRATYLVSRRQWDWAMTPNVREADAYPEENLLPMKESGQLQFVEEEEYEPVPGFRLRMYHGHTEGQLIPFIQYRNRTVVFMADLIPSVAHIPLKYNMSYDVYPVKMLEEKEAFLKEAVENGYVLFFQHDLYHECCILEKGPKGIRPARTFTLEEWI
ncbi:MAG TPA: MBL fold metallo-hydrolase [Bacteroidetes bacterium]|nr:MBL fold metallo-hydrolase [Bacteroidota bacterium]